MLFSDRSLLAKLRHSHPPPSLGLYGSNYEADLVSRDKAKQKEAVKRYLAEKVRDDWQFPWPPVPPTIEADHDAVAEAATPSSAGVAAVTAEGAGDDTRSQEPATAPEPELEVLRGDSGAELDSDAESTYSTVSEDPLRYRPRAEWTSDWSDDDAPIPSPSPFRFDTPDSVGVAVQASTAARKAKMRREDRAEMEWNVGLACFNARRDAWTGARRVRVKPKPASPISPRTATRRSLWRFHAHSKSDTTASAAATATANIPTPALGCPGSTAASPLSPVTSNSRHSQHSAPETSTPLTSDGGSPSPSQASAPQRSAYAVETLLPIPLPLLPPANPMRASISPAIYLSLYDKVVVHSLQPSCPINLADMARSCVVGWKRDGDWPPRPSEMPAAAVVVVRKKRKEDKRDAMRDGRGGVATPASPTRRMSFGGLLGRGGAEDRREGESDDAGRSIRRSLQRVLGLGQGHGHGHGHSMSVGSIGSGVGKELAGAG